MSFLRISKYSKQLGYQNEFSIYYPDKLINQESLHVILLLHGLSGNQTDFEAYNINKYAEELNCLLVYVNAHNSYYLDTLTGENFSKYVGEEILQNITDMFNVKIKRKSIIGISMGGYGSMYLGLSYNFDDIVNLSGSVILENRFSNTNDGRFYNLIDKVEENLKIEQLLVNNKDKRIYSYCGSNDFLYQDNLVINQIIEDNIKDFKITTDLGDHSFKYWNKQMKQVFNFIREGV